MKAVIFDLDDTLYEREQFVQSGFAAVGEAFARGVSGIGPVRSFPTHRCWSRLGGEAGDVTPHLQDGEARRMARASQLGVIAARLALADAGFPPGQLGAVGLVLGSHWGDFRSSESFALGFLERVRDAVGGDPLQLKPHHASNASTTSRRLGYLPSSPLVFVRLRMPNSLRPRIAAGS